MYMPCVLLAALGAQLASLIIIISRKQDPLKISIVVPRGGRTRFDHISWIPHGAQPI